MDTKYYTQFETEEALKFIYSKKATKFSKISTVNLCYVVPVKSTMDILQNIVAFSEYMNFKSWGRLAIITPLIYTV